MPRTGHRHHERLYPGCTRAALPLRWHSGGRNACSTIKRLYAAGECSCTGLHGANRLASNSLIEAIVYAEAAAKHSIAHLNEYTFNDNVPDWDDEGTKLNEEMVLITQSQKEVEDVMSNYVGIVRSNLRLERALKRMKLLYEETEACSRNRS